MERRRAALTGIARGWRAFGLNRPRRALAAVGSLIVIGVVAILAFGGDDETPPVASEPSTTAVATTEGAPGPDVPPIQACSLLSDADVEAALGLADLDFVDRGLMTVGAREGCTWRNVRDGDTVDGLAVQIAPGEPDDLAPGATYNDLAGTPVDGLGVAATWFGGDDAGIISVAEVSRFGYIFARVLVQRGDVDDAQRREIAAGLATSALLRMPGVAAPEPELTTIDPDPPDRSGVGFTENLLAREAAGEWTMGEGLVETLALLAGERNPDEVLRHPDLLETEATGILSLAQQYLETGEDPLAQQKIADLLRRLAWSNEQLEGMAGIASQAPAPSATPSAESATATSGTVQAVARQPSLPVQPLADPVVDCAAFYDVFARDEGVGKCIEWRPANVGPGVEEDKYRLFVPAAGMPQAGWTEADYDAALTAMEHSALILERLGEMPRVNMVMTAVNNPGASASAANPGGGKPCGVFIYTYMQGLPSNEFQFIIAHELGHCFTAHNFTEQSNVWKETITWWEEGGAEFLASFVYPTYNEEWYWSDPLAAIERSTGLIDRAYDNVAFFQTVADRISDQFVLTVMASMPSCPTLGCSGGGLPAQAAALGRVEGMPQLYQRYVELMTDGAVRDSGGLKVPFKPQADEMSGVGRHEFLLDAFEMARVHVTVPDGQVACVRVETSGSARASFRSGKPDGSGLERQWILDMPNVIDREVVFAATTPTDGATFSIEIRKIVEDDRDCEEDDGSDLTGPVCDLLCAPSDFFKSPEGLESWVLQMLPPLP